MRMGKAHLKKLVVLLSLLFGSVTFIHAQDVDGLISLIEMGKLDSAKKILTELSFEYPSNPGVRYARALLQDDALIAAGLYKDIDRNHGESAYAASAIMHLGEYYYAQGLYVQSRQYFSRLIRFHPNHPDIVNAVNLSLRAGIASRQMDSVYIDLAEIVAKYPDMAFDIPEELDITRIPRKSVYQPTPIQEPSPSGPPMRGLGQDLDTKNNQTRGQYSLQAGAFGNYDNAKRLAEQIESIGYTTRINERPSGGNTLYLIMVGDYSTKTAALSVSDMLEAALGIPSFPVANN